MGGKVEKWVSIFIQRSTGTSGHRNLTFIESTPLITHTPRCESISEQMTSLYCTW